MNKISFKIGKSKSVKPATAPKKTETKKKNLSFGRFTRLSIKDQTFFAKRLAFLIKAGIPILESLTMIREQTRRKSYGRILDSIISDVSNGQYLSTSLAKFRNSFGDFSINIIAFGESSGILSENLEYLAEELKKKQLLRKKIVSAFIYPAIVTIATFAITGFLMIYLFPKIMPIFQSIHADLPLSTRIVIAISNYSRHYGLITILAIIAVVIATIISIKKSKKIHYYFDQSILKTPIIGQIIQGYNLANSTRTLGLLLKSGISLSEAIPIASKTTMNLVYKQEFENLSEMIDRGERISTYLKNNKKVFPEITTQIISVGERSGNLSNSLIYLSEMYEAEVDDFTKNLSNMIEPILMIIMGILVGFIAISIITPIYSITQHLNPR